MAKIGYARISAKGTVDPVRCAHCDGMFEPYANEWFCSDECHSAHPDEWPKVRY